MIKGFIGTAAAATLLAMAAQAASAQPVGRAVSIGEGATALHGALLSPPEGPSAPAVLIIAGSGPTDRDGNSPLGVRAQTYKLLAEGLADRGITSLRYDKRGIAASSGAAAREEDVRIETYAQDATAWAQRLKAESKAPCVWLIGHSEGALIGQLAAREPSDVCGLVLVSGAGRRAGDLLREQLTGQLPEPLKAAAFATLAELEAGRTTAAPPELAALFRPSVQPYLISWFRHDPAELLRGFGKPVLIIQGTTDLQATMADAERLAAANPGAKLVRLPGVNHVLKTAPMDRAANLAIYADPDLPLAPGVVDAIADFMAAHAKR